LEFHELELYVLVLIGGTDFGWRRLRRVSAGRNGRDNPKIGAGCQSRGSEVLGRTIGGGVFKGVSFRPLCLQFN
jgi:hypothetical protein